MDFREFSPQVEGARFNQERGDSGTARLRDRTKALNGVTYILEILTITSKDWLNGDADLDYLSYLLIILALSRQHDANFACCHAINTL